MSQWIFPRGTTRSSGLAVASLVMGIVGLLVSLFGIIPILAVVFGVMARRRGENSGLATAGIVLGIIGLVLMVVVLGTWGANPTLFGHHG
jgi:hypothetical protein